jgi:hypothetical protein
MLGVAAERVFLLLCDSIHGALADAAEKSKSAKILERQATVSSSNNRLVVCRDLVV